MVPRVWPGPDKELQIRAVKCGRPSPEVGLKAGGAGTAWGRHGVGPSSWAGGQRTAGAMEGDQGFRGPVGCLTGLENVAWDYLLAAVTRDVRAETHVGTS